MRAPTRILLSRTQLYEVYTRDLKRVRTMRCLDRHRLGALELPKLNRAMAEGRLLENKNVRKSEWDFHRALWGIA
jgi:hypothetical protein